MSVLSHDFIMVSKVVYIKTLIFMHCSLNIKDLLGTYKALLTSKCNLYNLEFGVGSFIVVAKGTLVVWGFFMYFLLFHEKFRPWELRKCSLRCIWHINVVWYVILSDSWQQFLNIIYMRHFWSAKTAPPTPSEPYF